MGEGDVQGAAAFANNASGTSTSSPSASLPNQSSPSEQGATTGGETTATFKQIKGKYRKEGVDVAKIRGEGGCPGDQLFIIQNGGSAGGYAPFEEADFNDLRDGKKVLGGGGGNGNGYGGGPSAKL